MGKAREEIKRDICSGKKTSCVSLLVKTESCLHSSEMSSDMPPVKELNLPLSFGRGRILAYVFRQGI